MQATVKYIHKISPRATDVEGPFPINTGNLATLEDAQKWLRKHGVSGARKRHARRTDEGGWVFFPPPRSIWHSISIVVGT